jgi:hypothetical protein
MSTFKYNLPTIYKGATYNEFIQWENEQELRTITNVGTTVTVQSKIPHGFTTGNLINIRNIFPEEFNIEAASITVTSNTTFTYVAAIAPTELAKVPNQDKKASISKGIDLTNCTAKIQIRELPDAIAAPTVILELSTENGRITLTSALGKITLSLTDEVTTLIEGLEGYYNLEIYHPDGTVTRLTEGKVKFSTEVTI